MPSPNRIVVASAGSGKTTHIIDSAAAQPERAAILTYTTHNTAGIENSIYERIGFIPPHVTVSTWYSFLLRHCLRPYQRALYGERIERLLFVQGKSALCVAESDTAKHYFGKPGVIYSDKVTKFACKLIKETNGKPMRRLEQIFDHIYIDEAQDLAGSDLDLVESLMKSRIKVTLVGDHRQATLTTHAAGKHKKFARTAVINKFVEWKRSGLCELEFKNESRRCIQAICDFADIMTAAEVKTVSLNQEISGHDGVFAVRERDVEAYFSLYSPQTLRYDKRTTNIPGRPLNFGACKGLTFNRVLIYPTGPLRCFIEKGVLPEPESIPKLYVAVTRARQSAAIVVKTSQKSITIPVWSPTGSPFGGETLLSGLSPP